MSTFTSPSERRWWLLAGLTLGAIYATLGVARIVIELLRQSNLLRISVVTVLAAVALLVGLAVARQRPGWREASTVAACGVVYLIALLAMERAEERLHLLEYGLVAGLVHRALDERRLGGGFTGRVWLWAIAVTAAAGWLDEGIQAILPSRVYDLRDVAFNTAAGVLAVGSIEARRWARQSDRSGSAASNAEDR